MEWAGRRPETIPREKLQVGLKESEGIKGWSAGPLGI